MNQAKKRVLYLITKAAAGGAQKYVHDLATRLPAGYEPAVAYGTKGRLSEDLARAGVHTHRLPSLGRDVALVSDVKSFFEIWRCVRAGRPDVVHLNSSKAAALGALAARLAGVKRIVFTVHGWPFKESRGFFWRAPVYLISWFTALLAHAVVVVSKQDENIGKRMPFVSKKVRYIPVGIEPPAFLSREEASRNLDVTTALPRIVTIAELTANKGLRYAVEAIAMLADRHVDAEYYIFGEGEGRRMLEYLALERGVAERVHFLGFVDDAARYLKAFDLFLLPSVKEGMPYVLLEAAAADLPILTTTAVDPAAAGGDESVLAVPPADARALADALVEALRLSSEAEVPLFCMTGPADLSTMVGATVALY